jgi:hypothetical protein
LQHMTVSEMVTDTKLTAEQAMRLNGLGFRERYLLVFGRYSIRISVETLVIFLSPSMENSGIVPCLGTAASSEILSVQLLSLCFTN